MAKSTTLQPGTWCALAPLFANRFLPCGLQHASVAAEFGGIQALPMFNQDTRPLASPGGYVRPHIRTLADLLCAWWVITHVVAANQPHPLLASNGDSNANNELEDINNMVAQVPHQWKGATLTALNCGGVPNVSWRGTVLPDASVVPPAAEQIVESMLVSRLGWIDLASGKPAASVASLTVKQATSLQLGPLRSARREKHAAFVRCAIGGSMSMVVDAGLKLLYTAFTQCWKMRWDNAFKEVFWRLALDGLPTAARMHMPLYECLCGEKCPGYDHHFWSCPIARAVIETLESQLQPPWCAPGGSPVQKQHVWLMHPPVGNNYMHRDVWRVVCLAALNAMHVGLKAANKHHHQQCIQQSQHPPPEAPLPPGQRQITQWFAPAVLTDAQLNHQQAVQVRRQQQQLQLEAQQQQQVQQLLQVTKQLAVARFWELLTDWAVMQPRPRWRAKVAVDHPLLCRDAQNDKIVLAARL